MSEPLQTLSVFRKRRKLSQAQLAAEAGVSQATISRLEKGEQQVELRTLAKIAKALGVDLRDLLPDSELEVALGQLEQNDFYAFCPNPFCQKNSLQLTNGQPSVSWKSGQKFPRERFGEVNFCTRCGEELAKECSSCKRRLEDVGTRFCVSCGRPITTRPTAEEWTKIGEMLKQTKEDDDIPF